MARSQPLATPLLSSSPAFGSPLNARTDAETLQPSILPVIIPPSTLRPVAFRIFTKKHSLNLTSAALELLAQYVGKVCGSGWRDRGLAEKYLDEAAKQWKASGKGIVVTDDGNALGKILEQISAHADTQVHGSQSLSDHATGLSGSAEGVRSGDGAKGGQQPVALEGHGDEDHGESMDLRTWMRIIHAMEQPRLFFNPQRRHFVHMKDNASSLPDPSRKNALFRQRYNLIHQRLLGNESFQKSAVKSRESSNRRVALPSEEHYKLTLVANLLGRGGSQHLLFGLLARSPSGHLTLNDPTGSVVLDLQYAREAYEDAAWVTPGMIIIIDGQYADADTKIGADLSTKSGIGGTIVGSFVVFGLIGPPSERREYTLGIGGTPEQRVPAVGAGFGWVDFLGVGSQKATGNSMRLVENRLFDERQQGAINDERNKILILGEVNLDVAKNIRALRKILALYAANSSDNIPMAVVLIGNFASRASMAGGVSGTTVDYKECFDTLASTLSDYPNMLHNTTFLFVPGDNDPWSSSHTAGASTMVPRPGIPELFTSRIRRAFATANADEERVSGKAATGEAIWSSNPTRVTFCGPRQEIVIFKDEMLGRLRRNAISMGTASREDGLIPTTQTGPAFDGEREKHAKSPSRSENVQFSESESRQHEVTSSETQTVRKLIKTIIDQGHLSPFPPSQRPIHWDHAHALHLYPLPTALILMDSEAPRFAIGLDGCHVMNPGPLAPTNKKGMARWIEYSVRSRRGHLKELHF